MPLVYYLGCNGFPYGMAEVQKLRLVSKSLVHEGVKVVVVNYRGIHNELEFPNLKSEGVFEGINYVYTSGTPYRVNSFIKRNFLKLIESIQEYKYLKYSVKSDDFNYGIVSNMNFCRILYYRVLSKLLGFKIALNLVEKNSAMKNRKKWKFRINDFLFDHLAVKLVDGVLPISEYLINEVKKNQPGKPYLKIPVLVDFDKFCTSGGIVSFGKYFLYCGAAGYEEVIGFIIRSFECFQDNSINLVLICNGTKKEVDNVNEIILKSLKKDFIKYFQNLNEADLMNYYSNALGLLIPLRPTVQDEARFPHKIGEYLATGVPVVTTNYGEVKYYLKNNINAIICSKYNEQAYFQSMKEVAENPNIAIEIGRKGRQFAKDNFDYKLYGVKIIDFLKKL